MSKYEQQADFDRASGADEAEREARARAQRDSRLVIYGFIHDDDDSEFEPENVALVADRVRVIRASEVVSFMKLNEASLRTAAPYFGVSFSTLSRFLHASGYRSKKNVEWANG